MEAWLCCYHSNIVFMSSFNSSMDVMNEQRVHGPWLSVHRDVAEQYYETDTVLFHCHLETSGLTFSTQKCC